MIKGKSRDMPYQCNHLYIIVKEENQNIITVKPKGSTLCSLLYPQIKVSNKHTKIPTPKYAHGINNLNYTLSQVSQ